MTSEPENTVPIGGLQDIANTTPKALPPVHLWQPETRCDIDMCIHRDGTWSYMGSPIRRERMVRLFSSILRRDDDERYYLVTPTEKCAIQVEDVPFVVTGLAISGSGRHQSLIFTTNVGDVVHVGQNHPLRFQAGDSEGVYIPYVVVRARLEARIARAVYYDVVEQGCVQRYKNEDWFGQWSGECFWPMALASDIGAD